MTQGSSQRKRGLHLKARLPLAVTLVTVLYIVSIFKLPLHTFQMSVLQSGALYTAKWNIDLFINCSWILISSGFLDMHVCESLNILFPVLVMFLWPNYFHAWWIGSSNMLWFVNWLLPTHMLNKCWFSTLRPRKMVVILQMCEHCCMLIWPWFDKPSLVQIKYWAQTGDKSISVPFMAWYVGA